jgi:hypothetical protein
MVPLNKSWENRAIAVAGDTKLWTEWKCIGYNCVSLCLVSGVRMRFTLSVCLSVCLYASLPVCLSLCLPVCLPACLHASLPVCLSLCLPACLPVCLHVFLPDPDKRTV